MPCSHIISFSTNTSQSRVDVRQDACNASDSSNHCRAFEDLALCGLDAVDDGLGDEIGVCDVASKHGRGDWSGDWDRDGSWGGLREAHEKGEVDGGETHG